MLSASARWPALLLLLTLMLVDGHIIPNILGLPHHTFRFAISDEMVDIGDIPVEELVIGHMNAHATIWAIGSYHSYNGSSAICKTNDAKNMHKVTVEMLGHWGVIPPYSVLEVRTQIFKTIQAFVANAAPRHHYPVYRNCFDPDTNIPATAQAQYKNRLCAPTPIHTPWHKPCPCYNHWCTALAYGHHIPARITLAIYNDKNELLADGVDIRFTAVDTPKKPGGCGMLGGIGLALNSVLPDPLKYVQKVLSGMILVGCAYSKGMPGDEWGTGG